MMRKRPERGFAKDSLRRFDRILSSTLAVPLVELLSFMPCGAWTKSILLRRCADLREWQITACNSQEETGVVVMHIRGWRDANPLTRRLAEPSFHGKHGRHSQSMQSASN
jgi:hypothetical protein